jgi:hypothetical protein
MPAELIFRFRDTFHDGAILEGVVWRVPAPMAGCAHPFKYRLFYGYPGRRVLGFDNERGKGDHLHRAGTEQPYLFSTPERLIEDFLAEVRRQRK